MESKKNVTRPGESGRVGKKKQNEIKIKIENKQTKKRQISKNQFRSEFSHQLTAWIHAFEEGEHFYSIATCHSGTFWSGLWSRVSTQPGAGHTYTRTHTWTWVQKDISMVRAKPGKQTFLQNVKTFVQ